MTDAAAKVDDIVSLDARRSPIVLRWEEGARSVSVNPKDQDHFTVTVEEAIKACKARDTFSSFQVLFKRLLIRLKMWTNEHSSKIKLAYLTVRDASLLFVVITKLVEYDRDLEDELTELDLEIANEVSLSSVRLNVLLLPPASPDSIAAFIAPQYLLTIFSDLPVEQ